MRVIFRPKCFERRVSKSKTIKNVKRIYNIAPSVYNVRVSKNFYIQTFDGLFFYFCRLSIKVRKRVKILSGIIFLKFSSRTARARGRVRCKFKYELGNAMVDRSQMDRNQ